MILDQILEEKRKRIDELKKAIPLEQLREQAREQPSTRDFKGALTGPEPSLIAELKKASPSAGVIRDDFEPDQIAKTCEEGGAAAISVLTESQYFQGSLDYLEKVKANASIPVLRKDFIIDQYQLYESKVYGADAVLLIAKILDREELGRLFSLAKALGLDALIEVHNQEELDGALEVGAEIIGINNRNLQSLEVDLSITLRLSSHIPKGKVVVSESGIRSGSDVELICRTGRVNAILVGESLMRSDDIKTKMRELLKTDYLKEA